MDVLNASGDLDEYLYCLIVFKFVPWLFFGTAAKRTAPAKLHHQKNSLRILCEPVEGSDVGTVHLAQDVDLSLHQKSTVLGVEVGFIDDFDCDWSI